MNEPLPPVFEGLLDEAGFEALLRDLASCAVVHEVRVRGDCPNPLRNDPIELHDAAERFRQGNARGLQIRYEHEGALWCDTLSRTSAGIRVVRVRQPAKQGS